MPNDIFLRIMAASYVGKRDLRLTPSRISQVRNFQQSYIRLIAALGEPFDAVLKTLLEIGNNQPPASLNWRRTRLHN
jgi:hypothetical protein